MQMAQFNEQIRNKLSAFRKINLFCLQPHSNVQSLNQQNNEQQNNIITAHIDFNNTNFNDFSITLINPINDVIEGNVYK
jgi:hypothetical protein